MFTQRVPNSASVTRSVVAGGVERINYTHTHTHTRARAHTHTHNTSKIGLPGHRKCVRMISKRIEVVS